MAIPHVEADRPLRNAPTKRWAKRGVSIIDALRALRRTRCVGTPLALRCSVEGKPITGDACVEALLRAGFRIRSNGNGIAILVRGANVVMVPDLEAIEPALMSAILRSSGLTREELDVHLQHYPKRSGFFPRVTTPDREREQS